MALTNHFVEDKRNCIPSLVPLENHEAGKSVSISTLQIIRVQMTHEQVWPHHSPSMSLQFDCSPTAVLTVLEVALGQRVDFIGLGAFQRYQLIRKEDRWDVEVFPGMGGLCSPHHGGPLWDCSYGQVLWVDYSVHKQWMKVGNSGQPWFATAQHVLAGIAGKSLKGILHQYLTCWQMQHQRQIEKSQMDFHKKPWQWKATATRNIEL